tara:strand:+ start:1578 stop:1871 length:294 start_codon:yes stop_codon:yes gene_type:complete
MKNMIFGIIGSLMIFGATDMAQADVWVNGHYKNNGTYVQPHYRSSPNSSRLDNWSTRGNTNPYTGQRGYNNPYGGSNSLGGSNTLGGSSSLYNSYDW